MTRFLGFSLILTWLLTGCGDGGDNYSFKLDVPETKTWPAVGVLKLDVSTPNGGMDIFVTGADPISAEITRSCRGTDRADAEAHIDNVTVTDSLAGDTLTIAADMPDPNDRSYNAYFDIESSVVEYMNLHIDNGGIGVVDHQGSLDVKISNGDIACVLAALPAAGWTDLETVNGVVILDVPADVSATFDIQVVNGTVTVSGLDSATYTIDESNHKAGTLGAGDAEINITVSNGEAYLQAR